LRKVFKDKQEERVVDELTAALSLVEPSGIRKPNESEAEVALRILKVYNQVYRYPDLNLARFEGRDGLAKLLIDSHKLGRVDKEDF